MQFQHLKPKVSKHLKALVEEKKFLSLDVGCGAYKRQGAVGMDIRPLPGVDIVHDITHFPWPIPDEVCGVITASHVLEHIPKWGTPSQLHLLTELLISKGVLSRKDVESAVGETQIFSMVMRFMDECWRISKDNGQLAMVLPYAGSTGFYQDPTHTSPINEATFFYFDPEHSSRLWHIYKPKPWKIDVNTYQQNGNLEIILSKRPMIPAYEQEKDYA